MAEYGFAIEYQDGEVDGGVIMAMDRTLQRNFEQFQAVTPELEGHEPTFIGRETDTGYARCWYVGTEGEALTDPVFTG